MNECPEQVTTAQQGMVFRNSITETGQCRYLLQVKFATYAPLYYWRFSLGLRLLKMGVKAWGSSLTSQNMLKAINPTPTSSKVRGSRNATCAMHQMLSLPQPNMRRIYCIQSTSERAAYWARKNGIRMMNKALLYGNNLREWEQSYHLPSADRNKCPCRLVIQRSCVAQHCLFGLPYNPQVPILESRPTTNAFCSPPHPKAGGFAQERTRA